MDNDILLDGSVLLGKILDILDTPKPEVLKLILMKADVKIVKNADGSIEVDFVPDANDENAFLIEILINVIMGKSDMNEIKNDLKLLFGKANKKEI